MSNPWDVSMMQKLSIWRDFGKIVFTATIGAKIVSHMMTSSNGNIFCVTGPLRWESTGDRWIPLTKANDAELWCFLSTAAEQTVEQTMQTPVFWDTMVLIMTWL